MNDRLHRLEEIWDHYDVYDKSPESTAEGDIKVRPTDRACWLSAPVPPA